MSSDTEPTTTSPDKLPTPEVADLAPVTSTVTTPTINDNHINSASSTNDGDRTGHSSAPCPTTPTMIVPADHPTVAEDEAYPPNDACAMSPRRTSEETEGMGRKARLSVQEYVHSLNAQIYARPQFQIFTNLNVF